MRGRISICGQQKTHGEKIKNAQFICRSVSRQCGDLLILQMSAFLTSVGVGLRPRGAFRGNGRSGRAGGRWRCNIGNVEQLPLERVPPKGPLPPQWGRPGVYGVYSSEGALQYVASALNVRTAIDGHRSILRDADRVFAVRMITLEPGQDTDPIDQFAETWVHTHTNVTDPPPGNCEEAPEWREEPEDVDVRFQLGAQEENANAEILRLLRRHRIILFMKGTSTAPKCGFSEQTLMILRREGAPEDVLKCVDCLDGDRNPGLREQIKLHAQWPTIPQLYINGDFVGGADIVKDLAETGNLRKMLSEAAAQPAYTGN